MSAVTGEWMAFKARKWVEDNPGAWAEMKRLATERAGAGKRVSIDMLAVEARYRMRVNGTDEGFRFNNTLRAPLARMMVEECPHLDAAIERRRSKADG